jgi:hypothetical protein
MPAARAAACAVASLLVVAAPADAADPWLGALARKLRADPVYVSDSVPRAVSPAEAARLRASVRAMPFATRVAILGGPPNTFGVGGLDLFELPELLAGAVDRPGLYVVVDGDDAYGSIRAAAVGVRPRVAARDIERAILHDVPSGARPVARIRYALRVAATGARPARDSVDLDSHDDGEPLSTEDLVAASFAGGGLLAGLAIPTVRWWRRRPRPARRTPRREPVLREPDDDVADQAGTAIERLSAAIAAAAEPSDEVFELYSAASKADREARSPLDHLGALLLAEDAAALLAGRARPRRCFFDPGHGVTSRDTRWRLGSEETEVPACNRCVRRLKAKRMPDALGDRGKPYYERDSVWARTGFGAIDDELAARVLSGR